MTVERQPINVIVLKELKAALMEPVKSYRRALKDKVDVAKTENTKDQGGVAQVTVTIVGTNRS